ncbi:unnamed protein product [Mycena citricolor]|uniref:NADP-dependent oxidoreductase domain-containing protein n=1 Tax=Mycena citricolor TaxID=2018698 RepID=A0AAD2H7V9_9AGAR|nr:unnamed protein product [Mycena citricolor]
MSAPKKMTYVRLGSSGLKVSKIILGCMSYGDPKWMGTWVLPEEEAEKHIKAAYDAGINTFDTANVYSNGLSEEILGRAIKKYNLPRDEIVVMTKLFSPVGKNGEMTFTIPDPDAAGFVNQHGLSRKHIFDSVKASLKRLGLDYIDLFQCHRFDPQTPIAETMQALHDVVKAGYVRYIGMSSCYAYQFQAMQNYAINNNLTPFISMQNHYSLLYREEEREMMPTLKHFGVGSIPWSPLARGALTRPLSSQQTARGTTDLMSPALYTQSAANQNIVKRVEELAAKYECSMAQIGVAWVLNKDPVSAPIIGTTSLKNLEDILGAVNLKLTAEDVKYLEEPYMPMSVLGHYLRIAKHKMYPVIEISDSEDEYPHPPSSSQPPTTGDVDCIDISSDSDDDLPATFPMPVAGSSKRKRTPVSSPERRSLRSAPSSTSSVEFQNEQSGSEDDEESPRKKVKKSTTGKQRASPKSASQKEVERDHKKQAAEAKKAQKTAEKAEKAKKLAAEKATKKTFQSANKLVINKKNTLKNMELILSPSFQGTVLADALRTRLEEFDMTVSFAASRIVRGHDVFKWRRMTTAEYDEEARQWMPSQECVKDERTCLIHLKADELVRHLKDEDGGTGVVKEVRAVCGNKSQVFIMVDGLKAYLRRKSGIRMTKPEIERSLAALQMAENVHLLYVDTVSEAVERLYDLSADLGIKPYKLIERSHLPFCSDTRQATGTSLSDTWEKMLAQVHKVTPAAAKGIAVDFPSAHKLFSSYSTAQSQKHIDLMVAESHSTFVTYEMLPARGYAFIGLNTLRFLSIVTLLLVFASNVVTLVHDLQAFNQFQAGKSVSQIGFNATVEGILDGDYIPSSSIPNQPAGVFWAVLNRLLIVAQVTFLLFSEFGWPSALFNRYFPVMGKSFGLGPLGVMQCLLGAAILSHRVDQFSLVSAFFMFSIGCLNIFFGLVFRESARGKRSFTSWREHTKDALPTHVAGIDIRPGAPLTPSFASNSAKSDEKGDHARMGYGFGGLLITKPVESLPRYAPTRPSSQR